jgi:hypothetical protein
MCLLPSNQSRRAFLLRRSLRCTLYYFSIRHQCLAVPVGTESRRRCIIVHINFLELQVVHLLHRAHGSNTRHFLSMVPVIGLLLLLALAHGKKHQTRRRSESDNHRHDNGSRSQSTARSPAARRSIQYFFATGRRAGWKLTVAAFKQWTALTAFEYLCGSDHVIATTPSIHTKGIVADRLVDFATGHFRKNTLTTRSFSKGQTAVALVAARRRQITLAAVETGALARARAGIGTDVNDKRTVAAVIALLTNTVYVIVW